MNTLLIIKAGETYPAIREAFGCFEDWVLRAADRARDSIQVVSVYTGATLPAPETPFAGVVITGSPAMVTDQQPWMIDAGDWLRAFHELHPQTPVLGICFGHQLLAHAFGGRVDYNPVGREVGTVRVELTAAGRNDELLGILNGREQMHVTHRQSVLELPPGAVRLAGNAHDANHAFRLPASRVWGVQFHPEFCEGIMRAYVQVLAARMVEEGLDPGAVAEAVVPCPAGPELMRRFSALSGE